MGQLASVYDSGYLAAHAQQTATAESQAGSALPLPAATFGTDAPSSSADSSIAQLQSLTGLLPSSAPAQAGFAFDTDSGGPRAQQASTTSGDTGTAQLQSLTALLLASAPAQAGFPSGTGTGGGGVSAQGAISMGLLSSGTSASQSHFLSRAEAASAAGIDQVGFQLMNSLMSIHSRHALPSFATQLGSVPKHCSDAQLSFFGS